MTFTDAPDNMEFTHSMLPTYKFQVPVVNGFGTLPNSVDYYPCAPVNYFLKSKFILGTTHIFSYLPSVQKKVFKSTSGAKINWTMLLYTRNLRLKFNALVVLCPVT